MAREYDDAEFQKHVEPRDTNPDRDGPRWPRSPELAEIIARAQAQGLADVCAKFGHKWSAELSSRDLLIDQCRCCGTLRYLEN